MCYGSSLGINYWDFFTYLDVKDMLIIFLLYENRIKVLKII